MGKKPHYRSVWISDVHLCTRDCQVGYLHSFLKKIRCDRLYIVGDFIDFWALKRRWYWPADFNGVIRRILKHVKKGTKVYYIPGNHDENLREFDGLSFGGVRIRRQMIHETADGRRLLVLHGDEFDTIVQARRWLARLGSWAYDYLIVVNRIVNAVRRRFGLPYYSLSGAIKRKVKSAVSYTGSFEQAVVHAANKAGVDGVVCGHIHQPAMKEIDGVSYYNTGDWIESCTALMETDTGEMFLLKFTEQWDLAHPESDDAEADVLAERSADADKLLALN